MTFRTWATIGLGVIGLATVIGGLVLGGGPEYARMSQRDQLRSQGISDVNTAVNQFYRTHGRLPTEGEYQAFFSGTPGSTFILGKNHPFEHDRPAYTASSTQDTYRLCTSFETEQLRNNGTTYPTSIGPDGSLTPYNDYWSHPLGSTCFNISIDPYTKNEVTGKEVGTISTSSSHP